MEIRYALLLDDHLAWYDYYLSLPAGQRLRSSVPFFGKYLDRLRRRKFASGVTSRPNGHAMGERTLEAIQAGLREFSKDFSFTTEWKDIVLVAQTSTHLFLAHSTWNAHIVPLRFFENTAKGGEFLEFVNARVKEASTVAPAKK